ncbi:hypothetical protein ITJ42_03700 [Clavibacter michiganensis subsp. phaseoli]|uniref:Uncharacterized protein n=1 Tax=Clavibacter phaseoli TaxID=1734031 RepID=A0A8I0SIB2_9MICO|nr:hypothetical protein [Clavibacter phaseoli]MBF4630314.1 hypothetical protein [Clavibacter phaseoli]
MTEEQQSAPQGKAVRWAPLLVAGVAALLSWARLPWADRRVVWAEDGGRFLAARAADGFWATLFAPYDGYLHLWARILTGIVSEVLPLPWFAVGMAAGSCLLVGLVAAVVFSCSASVVGWLPARLALALATALVPTAPIEVLGNAANIHWYLLWASFWMVLHVPRTWRSSILLGLLGLSFALTEILTAVLAPLVLHRFRDARAWPVRAGYAVGLIAQVATTFAHRRPTGASGSWVSDAQGYVATVVPGIFLAQDSTLGALLARTGWWIGLVLVVPFAASLVYVLLRARPVVRVAAIWLTVTSVIVWAASYRINMGGPQFDYASYGPEDWRSLYILRYTVVPSLCLIALPVLAAATLRERLVRIPRTGAVEDPAATPPFALSGRPAQAGAAVILAVLACLLLVNVTPESTRRTGQPTWSTELAAARDACRAGEPIEVVNVPIAPVQWGWSSTLPCSFVLRG